MTGSPCSSADTKLLEHGEKVTTHSEGEIQRLFRQLHNTPTLAGGPHPSAPPTSSSPSPRKTRTKAKPNSESSPDDCGGNNSPASVVNNHFTTTSFALTLTFSLQSVYDPVSPPGVFVCVTCRAHGVSLPAGGEPEVHRAALQIRLSHSGNDGQQRPDGVQVCAGR